MHALGILIRLIFMAARAARSDRAPEPQAPAVEIPDDTPFACQVARVVIGAAIILGALCALAPWFHVGDHDESLLFAGPMLVDTACISALVGCGLALVATLQPKRLWKRLALACLVLGIAALLDMLSTVAGSVAIGWFASLALMVIVFITTIAIPTRSDVIPSARIA